MIEQTHEIATPDGPMTTFVVHPERDGPHPVILFFMDAPAIREELRDMARRLATVGYYVMLPNLYHRAGVMEIGDLNDEATRTRMVDLMNGLTIPMVMADSDALLAFADKDPETGHLKKQAFGPCMMSAFGILAKFKFLRGTAIDPFGRTHERKMERQLIADYEALVDEVINGLNHDNARIANALLALPEQIRGYGHIKDRNIDKVKTRKAELLEQFRNPPEHLKAAE